MTPDDLYKYVNRVEPGLIRVDADEVTYPLHIVLRFELEQELFSPTKAMDVNRLPEEWSRRMKESLGVDVTSEKMGPLQVLVLTRVVLTRAVSGRNWFLSTSQNSRAVCCCVVVLFVARAVGCCVVMLLCCCFVVSLCCCVVVLSCCHVVVLFTLTTPDLYHPPTTVTPTHPPPLLTYHCQPHSPTYHCHPHSGHPLVHRRARLFPFLHSRGHDGCPAIRSR